MSIKIPTTINLRGKSATKLKKLLLLPRKVKLLFFCIVIVIIWLLVAPLLPLIYFLLFPPVQKNLPDYAVVSGTDDNEGGEYQTDGNRLFIPKIGVETKILEASSVDILRQEEGVWREPGSSTPETTAGNMVIAGHRFQYLPPNTTTFYNLHKLETGDTIQVYWQGKVYIYEIYTTFEVNPDEVWVRDADGDAPEITLYTCSPLYTSKKRLVIKARETESAV